MITLVEKLQDVLKRTAQLLVECELDEQASWFKDQLHRVRESGSDLAEVTSVASEVRSIIAGMGSFSDLSLQPSIHSKLSESQALKIKWNLADEMDAITAAILKYSNDTGNGSR